jgi:hypothetical protein
MHKFVHYAQIKESFILTIRLKGTPILIIVSPRYIFFTCLQPPHLHCSSTTLFHAPTHLLLQNSKNTYIYVPSLNKKIKK